MKEVLSSKRSLSCAETIQLTEDCSAVIQNKLSPILKKCKDPGGFTIPCQLNNVHIDKALCDLGASVSIISSSIYNELNLGHLEPTGITLQLADMSVCRPFRMLENVVLNVGSYQVPVDFLVLDMEEGRRRSMILGRPFLATAGAIIDVKDGVLMFR